MKLVKNFFEDNIGEICETNRKVMKIAGTVHKYRSVVACALLLMLCALPTLAQITPPTNPFPGQNGDQTITSWGDSITNLFLWALPIGSLVCFGLLIFNVIRKQPWSTYAVGLFLCLGGWGFVGYLAYAAANGRVIRPTGNLGN